MTTEQENGPAKPTATRPREVLVAVIFYAVIFLGVYWLIATWYGSTPAPGESTSPQLSIADAGTGEEIARQSSVPTPLDSDQKASFKADSQSRCRPHYPLSAVRQHLEGKAIIKVLVDTDGQAKDASVNKSSGSKELDHAAQVAAECVRFNPRTRDGQAIESYVLLPFDFHLQN